jgi:hypothetical protein
MSNPTTFANRLRFTIAQLERETAEGVENWTPTIDALRATLTTVEEEEGREESDKSAVARNLDRFEGILNVLNDDTEEVSE